MHDRAGEVVRRQSPYRLNPLNRSVAIDQYGYITAAQARGLGVSKASLSMLLKRERVSRVAYGVYRIPQIPATERDRFMLATLWTGADEAALSHETALDAYGVCDVNPGQVHVTVAKRRRIARDGGEGYAVHREDLAPEDLSWWEEIPAVTLQKAVEQCSDAGTPSHLLHQAAQKIHAASAPHDPPEYVNRRARRRRHPLD